jgi:hypothetical protein
MKKLRLPTPSRRCIFCNASGVTVEHVWPKWLRKFVPATASHHHSMTGTWDRGQMATSNTRIWSGDAQSRGIKAVCRGCNSGWMSKLEERVKPVVVPLLTGSHTILTADHQALLATWATMHIMVAEHYAPEKLAISDEEKHLFNLVRQPLPNWRIWIGNYIRGKWVGQWVQLALAIGEKHVSYFPNGDVARANTQATTFVVGQLYIHAFSCASIPDLASRFNLSRFGAQKLAQISPIKESLVAWPPNAMSNGDADRMARDIFEELNRIGDFFRNA